MNKSILKGVPLLCVTFASTAVSNPITIPFNGCTFFKARLMAQSYAAGIANAGCASFSAVNGRNGCRKVKGLCPFCVTYSGNDVQMWLPDYLIEVSKHVGRSVFADSADGVGLRAHLKLGEKWWSYSTLSATLGVIANGFQSPSGRDSFWHVRMLPVPYGSWVNNYPPLAASKGVGLPTCFSALSEFMPGQWNYNLADASYAAAWAPAGIPLCLTLVGGAAMGAIQEARAQVSQIANTTPSRSNTIKFD